MDNYIYDVNSECDWCEKDALCRYLYDNEVPVLAICQRCDTSPNTNQKENVMNTTFGMPVCDALTNKGCHNPGRFILEALVSGNVARKSLTDDLVGGNWTTMELHVCKLHLGILNRGKAINLKAGVNTLTSYTLTNPEELTLFTAEVLSTPTKEEVPMNTTINLKSMSLDQLEQALADNFESGAEISQMGSSAYETEEEYAAALTELGDEFDAIEAEIKLRTEKIACGHCKGRHATPAEVAACYGVERKPSRGPAPLIIKDHPNSKSQWFASKKDAIKFLKGLGDVSKGMNPANNGNGVWAWWKTNNS